MIQDLLNCGKINIHQYETYMLFTQSEMGVKWYKRMMRDLFMDTAPAYAITGELALFMHARESVLRDITTEIEFVENAIKEFNHDANTREQDARE